MWWSSDDIVAVNDHVDRLFPLRINRFRDYTPKFESNQCGRKKQTKRLDIGESLVAPESRAMLSMFMQPALPPPMPQAAEENDEEYDDEEDFYSDSDEYFESSDDELDWDPDRERLRRFVERAAPSLGGGVMPANNVDCAAEPRQMTLAERRREWRASRGLEPQRSIKELIAEKRAQRLGLSLHGGNSPGATSGAAAADKPTPLDQCHDLPLSLVAVVQQAVREPERAQSEQAVNLPARVNSIGAHSVEAGTDGGKKAKEKSGWWRTTK